MKIKFFDKDDLVVSFVLFSAVFLWGLIWAFPFPHPDLWSDFAVAAGSKCADTSVNCLWLFPARLVFSFCGVDAALMIFGLLGKASLGACAVLVYLSLRELWIQYCPLNAETGERVFPFFFAKLLPLVAGVIFALCPLAWRAFQFLSSDALVFACGTLAVTLWIFGRGMRHVWCYSASFLLCGAVASTHPAGAVLAFLEVTVDSFERWREKIVSGRTVHMKTDGSDSDDDDVVMERRAVAAVRRERIIAFVSFATGFALAFYVARRSAVASGAAASSAFGSVVAWWTSTELRAFRAMVSSLGGRCAFAFIALAGLAIKVSWRMHIDEMRPSGYWEKRFFSAVAALLGVVFFCHDIEYQLRPRLAVFRDFADVLAESVRGAKWVFTDGRLDDALRLSLVKKGIDANILSVMSVPNRAEINRLKELAPESGDKELFDHGGAEVFTSWARERSDRLRESAWQLGGRLVSVHGKAKFRTVGGVMREYGTVEALGRERVNELERSMRELSQRLVRLSGSNYSSGEMFGSVDRTTRTKYDSLLWRAARLSTERYAQFTKANLINEAQKERELAARLDELNHTLKLQGEYIERMLPTENLVLTPKEALDVALKRADFQLARKYANQVLVSFPDEQSAHFALAMAAMQEKDYALAARHFEIVRTLRPNEPATLNNLSLCYLKLQRYAEALQCAEKAAELQPNMERIQRNLEELRKTAAKAAERSRED